MGPGLGAGAGAGGMGTMGLYGSMIGVGVSALSEYQQGQSEGASLKYQSKVARNNSIMSRRMAEEEARRGEINAKDAIHRGKVAQETTARDIMAMAGRQKVMLAANGVDFGADSSGAEILATTAGLGKLDQETVINNAEREAHAFRLGAMDQVQALQQQAFNYKSQAAAHSAASKDAKTAGIIGAGSTLITGISKGAFGLEELKLQGVV